MKDAQIAARQKLNSEMVKRIIQLQTGSAAQKLMRDGAKPVGMTARERDT